MTLTHALAVFVVFAAAQGCSSGVSGTDASSDTGFDVGTIDATDETDGAVRDIGFDAFDSSADRPRDVAAADALDVSDRGSVDAPPDDVARDATDASAPDDNPADSALPSMGALGGPCWGTHPYCGVGLGCDGRGNCLPGIALGGTCVPADVGTACVEGTTCLSMGDSARCVADGALGTYCRLSAPECDPGLGCVNAFTLGHPGTCVAGVAVGGNCTTPSPPCEAGSSCVPVMGGPGPYGCVADGAPGGACRPMSRACDTTLTCGPLHGRCLPTIPLGGACDVFENTDACAPPNECAGTGTCAPPPYVESDIASPAFIDACAATGDRATFTDRHDAMTDPRAIGFSFDAFGMSYSQFVITTSGYIELGPAAFTAPFASRIPFQGATANAIVAPFWDELVLRSSPGSDVCTMTVGAAPDRSLVVEWLDVFPSRAATANLTFELVMHERTNAIDFIYRTADRGADAAYAVDGSRAGIGIQNAMGASYAVHPGTVVAARGLRFAPR